MRSIDTLIYAGWVIPVEPAADVLEHYAVAIDDGKIVDILPSDQAVSSYAASITHRLSGHVLIPGLINAHTHAAMNLLRGYADDLALMDWLQGHIWPAEQKWISKQFIEDGTRLAIAEMLLSGVTCFNDMYFFPNVSGKVAEEAGIRAVLGLIAIDFPSAWAQTPQEYLHKAEAVYEQFRHSPLVKTALAPHAPYTISDIPLMKVRDLAAKLDLRIHMHVHETAGEVEQSLKEYGERPLARLQRLGLVNERLMAVHMTQLEDAEMDMIAKGRSHVLHCPESNLKLASGFCPTPELMKRGINIALGTDSVASNNDLDMLGEMRTAALMAKGLSGDAAKLTTSEALRMATLDGAKALGIDHITGSLEIGKSADIVAIDLRSIGTQPVYNPLSQLVYAVNRDQVSNVWIAGKHLVKERSLTSLNIHDIHAKTLIWRDKISGLRGADPEPEPQPEPAPAAQDEHSPEAEA